MSLKVIGITANCGNDGLGIQAAEKIVTQLRNHDVVIITCQEGHESRINQQLRDAARTNTIDMSIATSDRMVTRTKLTELAGNTGLVTFVLSKPPVQVSVNNTTSIRRDDSASMGSKFNKGATRTQLIVTNGQVTKPYKLDVMNGHFDSHSDRKRAGDYANAHRLLRFSATTWDDLVREIPDSLISGFDANTRNQKPSDTQPSVSPWKQAPTPGMMNYMMAPLGNQLFSLSSTYKPTLKIGTPTAELPELEQLDTHPQRQMLHETRGGMLDFVCVNNLDAVRQELSQEDSSKKQTIEPAGLEQDIEPTSSERDHVVIGSGLIILDPVSEFERIRQFIACALVKAAPEITRTIVADNFQETPENKAYLLKLHQAYLAPLPSKHQPIGLLPPSGLMQARLHLQERHLAALSHFNTDEKVRYQQGILQANQPWFSATDTTDLPPLIQRHQAFIELEKLCLDFLDKSETNEEKKNVVNIVTNTISYCNSQPYKEIDHQALINDTRTLLHFNAALHKYTHHLDADVTEEIRVKKKNVTDELSAVLVQQPLHAPRPPLQSPGEIKSTLHQTIHNKKDALEHQSDNWLISLLQKLEKILFGEGHSMQFTKAALNGLASKNKPQVNSINDDPSRPVL